MDVELERLLCAAERGGEALTTLRRYGAIIGELWRFCTPLMKEQVSGLMLGWVRADRWKEGRP